MLFAAFLFARMKTLSGGRELWVLRAGMKNAPKRVVCVLRNYISPGEKALPDSVLRSLCVDELRLRFRCHNKNYYIYIRSSVRELFYVAFIFIFHPPSPLGISFNTAACSLYKMNYFFRL